METIMEYISYILGLVFIALSLGGVALFFYDRAKIAGAYLPIVSISAVTAVVYLGGVIGLLEPTVYAVYGIGIGLFVWSVFRIVRGSIAPKPLLSPAVIFFFVACLYFVIRMPGVHFQHTDNYSHWATIIKEMFYFDSYPNAESVVTFRNYAPGSATFVYFICKITGFTEGYGLMAQGIVVAASLTTVFAKAKWKNWLGIASLTLICIASVSIMTMSQASLHIYNFLVDALIAFVTFAAGVIVYEYRSEPVKSLIAALPVLAFLSIIKSSARFFVLLIAVMALIGFLSNVKKIQGKKEKRLYVAGAVGVPIAFAAVQFVLTAIWDAYVKFAYAGIEDGANKFEMSLSGLIEYISDKDSAYISDIASKMWTAMTDVSSVSVKIILIAEIAAILVVIGSFILGEKPKFLIKAFVAANLAGVFYLCELYVLYAYIFDEAEATVLASFYRYYGTGAILVSLVLLTASVYQLTKQKNEKRRIIALACALFVSCVCVYTVKDNAVQLFDDTQQSLTRRDIYLETMPEVREHVPRDSYVIMYVEESDFHDRSCLVYELLTVDNRVIDRSTMSNEARIKDLLSRADFLVILEDNNTFWEGMHDLGYSAVGGEASTVYEVVEENGGFIITACK